MYLKRILSDKKIIIVLMLSIFCCLFYQKAWQYPAIDAFPLAERMISPSFLLNDFYTNTFSGYSPRNHIMAFVVNASAFLGVEYTQFVAWANVIRIFCFFLALYWFYVGVEKNKDVVFISFYLSAISFLSVPVMLAWWPVSYDFTASNFSGLFILLSWGGLVRGLVWPALLTASISVYYHPLIGVHGALIGLVLYFSRYKLDNFLIHLKNPLVYLGVFLFVFGFLISYLSYDKFLPSDTFIEINAVYRHSHHFLFSHIEIEKIMSMFVYMSIITIFYVFVRHRGVVDDYTIPIFIYSLLMVCVGFVFVELYPTRFFVSFIPLRAFPILIPIAILCYARLMFVKFKEKDYFTFFIMHLPFFPYAKFGLTWYLLPGYHDLILPILIFIGVSLLVILTEFKKTLKNNVVNLYLDKLLYRFTYIDIVLPVFLMLLVFSVIRFEFNIPTLKNQVDIYSWLFNNTKNNDVILSELNAANNQKIRLVARRAVVVSKDFPFVEKSYEPWRQRFSDVYKDLESARGRVDDLKAKDIYDIMIKYKATILLRTKELKDNTLFDIIGRSEGEKSSVIIYRRKEGIK